MRTLHINGMTPPALAIAIALAEKGLDFTISAIDWRQTPIGLSPFSDSLELTATLEGEFPILVDDGVAVSDSYFVLEYLDDAYPQPRLTPANAYGQWQLQALARFFGERAAPALSTLGVAQSFSASPGIEDVPALFAEATALTSERRDAWLAAAGLQEEATLIESQRKLGILFERLEKLLAGGASWLLGETYSLSDIAGFALVHPVLAGQIDAGDIVVGDAVRRWHGRMLARPAVATSLKLGEPAFLPGPEHARWG